MIDDNDKNTININYNSGLVKSVLLLSLAISSNYIGSVFGCQAQALLSSNIYAKHVVLLFVIYFTINYISYDNPNPFQLIKSTLIIWMCYLIFIRQTVTFTAISVLLLMSTYIVDNYVNYYDVKLKEIANKKEKNGIINKKEKLEIFRNVLFFSTLLSIGTGFSLYFKEKHDEYANNFDYLKFILGTPECSSFQYKIN
jgi:hypothetical protein